MAKCEKKCEIFSRVVGYHRPVEQWNKGKKSEFSDRVEYSEEASLKSKFAVKGHPLGPLEKIAQH